MTTMTEIQEADLLRALDAIEQSWAQDWHKFSNDDRADQLDAACAIVRGETDYSGFAESTQLGRSKQLWLN